MRKFNFVKSRILKILLIVGIGVLTFSCMSDIDMPPKTYAEFAELHGLSSSSLSSSSSVDVISSLSSVEVVSSSSSSGEVEVSSSSVGLSSSSSEEVSSSSVDVSSSSEMPSNSSSSIEASSSSVTLSSSSITLAICGNRPEEFDPDLYRCEADEIIYLINSVTYDGEAYSAVLIGDQTWMARNLNYNANGSVCYDNEPSNCTTYGHLYNWATAMNLSADCNASTCANKVKDKHQGICPEGWHIPSNEEWNTLKMVIGGSSTAGIKLKAKSGWDDYEGKSGNGTNDYGFSALPGGAGYSLGDFTQKKLLGYWWGSTEKDATYAWQWFADFRIDSANIYSENTKSLRCSVRCLKDQ